MAQQRSDVISQWPQSQASATISFSPGTSSSFSSFQEIFAAITGTALISTVSMQLAPSPAGGIVTVFFTKGALGAEVEIGTFTIGGPIDVYAERTTAIGHIFEMLPIGTRISVKAMTTSANVGALNISFNLYMR